MKRLRVGVVILAASALAGVALVLLGHSPDDIERLLRSHGRVTTRYTESTVPGHVGAPIMQVTVVMPAERPQGMAIYAELKKRGWHVGLSVLRGRSNMVSCSMWGNEDLQLGQRRSFWVPTVNYVDIHWREERCEAIYYRPATRAEQTLHRIKAALHIAD